MKKAWDVSKRFFSDEKAAEVTELGIVLALILIPFALFEESITRWTQEWLSRPQAAWVLGFGVAARRCLADQRRLPDRPVRRRLEAGPARSRWHCRTLRTADPAHAVLRPPRRRRR